MSAVGSPEKMRLAITARDEGKFDYPFVYAHGKCEEYIAEMRNDSEASQDDLISGNISMESLSDGQYDVDIYGKLGTLFLWTPEEGGPKRGLVCLADDTRSMEDAEKKFKEKKVLI